MSVLKQLSYKMTVLNSFRTKCMFKIIQGVNFKNIGGIAQFQLATLVFTIFLIISNSIFGIIFRTSQQLIMLMYLFGLCLSYIFGVIMCRFGFRFVGRLVVFMFGLKTFKKKQIHFCMYEFSYFIIVIATQCPNFMLITALVRCLEFMTCIQIFFDSILCYIVVDNKQQLVAYNQPISSKVLYKVQLYMQIQQIEIKIYIT
eukprot:TRINITY_DN460_c0_g3_i1.p2 TRINITY_DN460_c0_g3~~TRINITY_DN460_c0_g3_i1.p2  ORF type:complete len:201 (-),score=-14.53 TRINITY_DN460_c0_g3_i1:774-1376(-)